MLDAKKLEQFAEKFSQSIPLGARAFKEDMENSFKQVLQSAIAKMDLVTREEFDVQKKVLAKTREKIVALEKVLAELDK
jgi:BMFP domain-containing protein YqiC